MHPLSPEPASSLRSRTRACGTATPHGALDADPSRLVVFATAGRAFTEIVPSSDVPCRPRAPSVRFQADRQLPLRMRFCRLRRRIHPPDQDRPTVLPRGRVNPLFLRERMEGRPKTPSIVSLSCELPHIDAAFQRRRPDALRHQTESNTCSARLTVRSALRAPVRSSVCLYTRLCGASSPRAFPTRT